MPRKGFPLRLPNDTPEMRAAIDKLEGYDGLRRTSEFQLKIADVNFYPNTGTVQIDRLSSQKARGIDEFIRLLKQRSLLSARSVCFSLYQIKPP